MACLFPGSIRNKKAIARPDLYTQYMLVPCGKCPECMKRKSDAWQFRLMQEEKSSTSAYFITLTYDTDFLPLTETGWPTLDKKHFPSFMKRLRSWHPKNTPIKYYAVGEYGSQFMRPHYHAIIFNVNIDYLQRAWTDTETLKPIGIVDVGTVGPASVAYVTNYLHKGRMIPAHPGDDRQPEFSLMSKGLGKNYLTPAIEQYHKADLTRTYVTLPGGVKSAMPRYYRERLFSPGEKAYQARELSESAEEAELKKFRDYSLRADPSTYNHSQIEAKKAQLRNFNDLAKSKRKKL